MNRNPIPRERVDQAVHGTPIGGGVGVVEPRYDEGDADIVVSEHSEFRRADSGRYDVVYIADGARIEITEPWNADNVRALIGGRYKTRNPGRLIFNERGNDFAKNGAIRNTSSPTYFGGFELQGPAWWPNRSDGYPPGYVKLDVQGHTHGAQKPWICRGLHIATSNTVVENCDIFGFPIHAILITDSSTSGVKIRHCELHDCMIRAYGYCIDSYHGEFISESNYFYNFRHAEDGFGHTDNGYISRNNVYAPEWMSHATDMHNLDENKVGNGNKRAGKYVHVYDNSYICSERMNVHGKSLPDHVWAVVFRGYPVQKFVTKNCQFLMPKEYAFRQPNVSGFSSWEISGNEYTPSQWTTSKGASINYEPLGIGLSGGARVSDSAPDYQQGSTRYVSEDPVDALPSSLPFSGSGGSSGGHDHGGSSGGHDHGSSDGHDHGGSSTYEPRFAPSDVQGFGSSDLSRMSTTRAAPSMTQIQEVDMDNAMTASQVDNQMRGRDPWGSTGGSSDPWGSTAGSRAPAQAGVPIDQLLDDATDVLDEVLTDFQQLLRRL